MEIKIIVGGLVKKVDDTLITIYIPPDDIRDLFDQFGHELCMGIRNGLFGDGSVMNNINGMTVRIIQSED